ncbi:MAG: hypothetical protein IPK26_06460 [Planctomycetes bacterium]|nr:hypothetical protein [Planctomycetota bacterium]
METAVAIVHIVCYIALAAGLIAPRLGGLATAVLAVGAVLTAVGAAMLPANATLTVTHTYQGYEGHNLEVSPIHFPVETVTAPGWQWPLPFALFCAVWAAILLWRRSATTTGPFLLPLTMAWTAAATWLLMQKLAAPSAIVQPVGIDRFLFPAGVAMAVLIARSAGSLRRTLLMVCVGTVAARLPIAMFSKLASDRRWGTALDIHSITDIVNPLNQMQFDPPLVIDDPRQQFWMIWAEHVFGFPAFYLMSLFGIAFGVCMAAKSDRMAE